MGNLANSYTTTPVSEYDATKVATYNAALQIQDAIAIDGDAKLLRFKSLVAIIDSHLEPAQPAARCGSCEREAAAIEIGKYCGARLDGKDEFYPCEGVIVAAAATPPAHSVAQRLVENQEDLDPAIAQALREDFGELYEDIKPPADAEQRARTIVEAWVAQLDYAELPRSKQIDELTKRIAAALPAPDSER